jgi:serine/threonine protein kinase
MTAVPAEFTELRPPQLGQVIGDRFEVVGFAGKGGMSLVYRVRDREERDEAALKVLRPELATWERVRERLAAEAVTMVLLRHPHIARIRDMGTDRPSDLAYVVIDWAPGGSAAERNKREGPLPVTVVARWGVEVASALAVAHERGVVHRDVKPGNILIGARGEALLADFGVALVPDAEVETEADALLGSVAYMPPEQRLCPKDVDPRSDLYALGATLYNLSARRNPVDLFSCPPDDPRWEAAPPVLRPVLTKATRFAAGERFADARAMALALAPFVPAEVWVEEPWLSTWLGV